MFNKLKSIYANSGYNIPSIIVFLLPFGLNLSSVYLFWGLCFFVLDDFKTGLKQVVKNKWSWVFFSFFIIHVFGYFFSTNKTEALTNIEIKMGFFVFPILIFASKYSEFQLKKIMISFVSGCLIASFICLLRATYLKVFEHFDAFFYSEFTYFMHPSYFAMYLLFAMLIVLMYYKSWLSHLTSLNIKIGFISIIFLISIFLCSSKMGLVTTIIILPIVFIIQFYKAGYRKAIIVLLAIFLVAIAGLYKFIPGPFERIKVAFSVSSSINTIDKSASESTAVRILIWKESLSIIKHNFLFGVTAGDVHDELCKAYVASEMTGALKKELNAHNQFLQTFMGTGIIGFILLLTLTLGLMIYAFIEKNYLLILFGAIMVLNFMVESMLQAQAGFIFFVFFACLLQQYNFNKQNHHA